MRPRLRELGIYEGVLYDVEKHKDAEREYCMGYLQVTHTLHGPYPSYLPFVTNITDLNENEIVVTVAEKQEVPGHQSQLHLFTVSVLHPIKRKLAEPTIPDDF